MSERGGNLIHAVAFPHGDQWVAQCLEYDIATQATTLDLLLCELERIVIAHLFVAEKEGSSAFGDIPRAPQRFWELYRRSLKKVKPVLDAKSLAPQLKHRPTFEVAFASAA